MLSLVPLQVKSASSLVKVEGGIIMHENCSFKHSEMSQQIYTAVCTYGLKWFLMYVKVH